MDLPPSERRELLEKISKLKIDAEVSWHCAIRSCIEAVNRADFLSEESKAQLIKLFYDKVE